ncbi:MAG TPA: UDP-N-acetylmuramoyl-L-alanyl-D-glutamate--2,6-diaminopimelate ligase [Acidimicrobiales bacterium]|nr:UDP-N-acetylmuramoyl-L-alanyl-D-glutamate--2,6-diaminopimelate ligase [Acidimicrobiales bacterium]
MIENSAKPLSDLLSKLRPGYRWLHASGDSDRERVMVSHLSCSSGDARPGSLHFCIRGKEFDGHDFADEAIANGAVALVSGYQLRRTTPVPQIVVSNVREAMAQLASEFYSHPSKSCDVIGITGTNGKTTTAVMLAHLLTRLGVGTAVFGTLTGQRTTPESLVFQKRIANALASGLQAVVTEVTSHGLVQHRVDATEFRLAVFTNLSRDHLDFHQDMDDYFEAKAQLFDSGTSHAAAVNLSTEWGDRLARRVDTSRVHLFDTSKIEILGVDEHVVVEWRGEVVRMPRAPRFYVENAVTAAESALALGCAASAVAGAFEDLPRVVGRYEAIDAGQPFSVVVDFAHTPDALEKVLKDTAEMADSAPVTVVFGCGGERDPGKRAVMGAIADTHADRVIVTSDNPRGEDPGQIAADVVSGIPEDRRGLVDVVLDRREAIFAAVRRAEPGDVVVIAGKGHEQYQEIDSIRLPFRDQEVSRQAIQQWVATGTGRPLPD